MKMSSILKCGNCGALLTAEKKIKRQRNGNIHYYVYYDCSKKKDENCIKNIKMPGRKKIEKELVMIFQDILSDYLSKVKKRTNKKGKEWAKNRSV